jgi:hypothetical protein
MGEPHWASAAVDGACPGNDELSDQVALGRGVGRNIALLSRIPRP